MEANNTIMMDGVEVVQILHVSDTVGLLVAKTALDDAGIPYFTTEKDHAAMGGFQGSPGVGEMPLVKDSICIFVRPEDEDAALSLVGNLETPETPEVAQQDLLL